MNNLLLGIAHIKKVVLDTNLIKRFRMWYWTRHYKKLLTTRPDSQEALDMALETGRLHDLKKLNERQP